MAFNPKDVPKTTKTTKPFSIPSNGKPAVIVSALGMIEFKAKEELKYRPGEPLKPIGKMAAPPVKKDYYIEWWQLGTNEKDIMCAEFSARCIKHFVKLLLAGGKYSLIYLERKEDGKVIWNRRSAF